MAAPLFPYSLVEMDFTRHKRRKPKLDRRNAIKNINYEPPSSSSFSLLSSPSSSELSPTLRTRSLDLSPFANQTSFRVEGIDGGEIDRICLSLGLSGPEDFAISVADWAASKSRSISSPPPPTPPPPPPEEEEVKDNSSVSRVAVIDDESSVATSASNNNSNFDRGGIKGARPPLLTPPPCMSLPRIDDEQCSSWDLLDAFAPPQQDTRGSSSSRLLNNDIQVRFGETTILSDSCSYSSSDDDDDEDDSSSTTTDPMYIISPSAKFKCNIKSWRRGSLLGSGSFGTVYEGLSDDGFFFAVKEVSLLDQGSQGKQSIIQLEQEISLLSQFEHENIVQYLGTDKDEEKLYIFLELVTKGSLAQLYQKYLLQDSQVSAYTRQILQGLAYLHERNVVHRDIKCGNILVDASGSVKLADFGLAKATKLNDVKSCKGTAFWMAPEVVNRKGSGYGLAADIWSLGCTVLEMLTRKLPYAHLEGMQALFKIGKGEPPLVPSSLSKPARDFIHRCLKVKADERPTAAQLLDDPFVKRSLSSSSESASPSHPNWRRT